MVATARLPKSFTPRGWLHPADYVKTPPARKRNAAYVAAEKAHLAYIRKNYPQQYRAEQDAIAFAAQQLPEAPAGTIGMDALLAVTSVWGQSNQDDINWVIRNWGKGRTMYSNGDTLGELLRVESDTDQSDNPVVIICGAIDEGGHGIAGGIVVADNATNVTLNAMVIGAWRGAYFGPGSRVKVKWLRCYDCQTWDRFNDANGPGGQWGSLGGYGIYSDAAEFIAENPYSVRLFLRNDGSKHQAGQYSWRSSGTTIVVHYAMFSGSDSKDFVSRMTDTVNNVIHGCQFIGGNVSLGGTSAGNPSELGTFTGVFDACKFDLSANKHVVCQPGCGPVEFHACTSHGATNPAIWLQQSTSPTISP